MSLKLNEILLHDECDWLDYKEKYWDNNADLVHDFLSLSNSLANSSCYLVLGIQDKTKAVVGIKNDENRKSKQQITDTIHNAGINRVPEFILKTEKLDNFEIDIIEIVNRNKKPYFLTKNFRDGKTTVRAGVAYTRNNDTNTPIDSSASESQLMEMWLERLGLNTPPLKRISDYILNKEGWKKLEMEEKEILYYQYFPEFTIEIDYSYAIQGQFKEEWLEALPDKNAHTRNVFLKYHTTILECLEFVSCDGSRYFVPLPEIKYINDIRDGFYYNTSEIYYSLWLLLEYMERKTPDCNYGQIMFLKLSKINIVDN